MGNLPGARTITIGTADAVPSALLDELQDMFVADRRTTFQRQFFPTCWFATGTPPTLVAAPSAGPAIPVWKIPTAQQVVARIPYEAGETLVAVAIEAFGDGAVDWSGFIQTWPSMNGVHSNIASITVTNQSATWALVSGWTVTPTVLAANQILGIEINPNQGTFVHLGEIYLSFSR